MTPGFNLLTHLLKQPIPFKPPRVPLLREVVAVLQLEELPISETLELVYQIFTVVQEG